MAVLAILLVILASVLAVAIYGMRLYVMDRRFRVPPGPMPIPFFGNMLLYMDLNKKPWLVANEMSKKYGDIWMAYYGQTRMVTIHKAEIIKEALITRSKDFSDRPHSIVPFLDEMGNGVVGSTGAIWRERRRFMMHALRDFGMGKNQMAQRIEDEVPFMMAQFEKSADHPFDPVPYFYGAASNVICQLVFGKRFGYENVEFIKLLEHLRMQLRDAVDNTNALYYVFPRLRYFKNAPYAGERLKSRRVIERMFNEAVTEHRKDYQKGVIRDFPDLFISLEDEQNSPFDYASYMASMQEMFNAGIDGSNTIMSWVLAYLASFPDEQRRCQQVIDEAIGNERYPLVADRIQLAYIEGFIAEVVRHAHPGPLAVPRANVEASTLAGYDIPAKTMIVYSAFDVHNDTKYWGDPENFRPERWLDADGKLMSHSNNFYLFGGGARSCLGEAVAKAEDFVFIAALIQRFTFSFDAGEEFDLTSGTIGISHAPPKYLITAKRRHH